MRVRRINLIFWNCCCKSWRYFCFATGQLIKQFLRGVTTCILLVVYPHLLNISTTTGMCCFIILLLVLWNNHIDKLTLILTLCIGELSLSIAKRFASRIVICRAYLISIPFANWYSAGIVSKRTSTTCGRVTTYLGELRFVCKVSSTSIYNFFVFTEKVICWSH